MLCISNILQFTLIKPGLKWAREPDPRKSLQPEISLSIFKDKPVIGIRISQIRIQNTAQITPDRTSVVDRHHLGANLDSTFYFDADSNPDSTLKLGLNNSF
jgi:hypothetical protein